MDIRYVRKFLVVLKTLKNVVSIYHMQAQVCISVPSTIMKHN